MPTKEDIDEIVAFLPRIGADDFLPVREWKGGERFCDGHSANVIEAGHIRRLLERLVRIRAEMD